MTRKRRRLYLVLAGMVSLCGAAALVLNAFNDDLVFFYSPTDLKTKSVPFERQLRIGGLVEERSVVHEANGRTIDFRVTDGNNTVAVIYTGSVPDLFREGQGVVAEGRLQRDGVFQASNVLAKHDENYMPPEVAEALKKSGHWQEGAGMPAGMAKAGTANADMPKTEAAQ
jgi:cytochrome c-type biogenesis protein CcmE